MTRVVVIGGGIAGYSAAVAARRDGAKVTVLARAPGATALYAGGMEIVDSVETALSSPHHPFARLGMDAVGVASELDVAMSTVTLALGKDGLKIEGSWRTRGEYADIHGLARPANAVPETVAPGELGGLRGKRVAVVGITQVGEYDAETTAQALKELHGIDAFAEEFTIADLPIAASLTDLYGRRAPAPRTRGSAVAYPPGFTSLPEGGFELLSSAPSPHGWRLQQAIGLGVLQVEVVGVEAADGRISAVRTKDRSYHADSFVLATGRHIGGGLEAGRTTTERLLGLGVFYEGRPIASIGSRVQHLRYVESAAELRSGVMTDRRLRPLSEDGEVRFENLFAAGAVLGGYDYAGAYGFGVPILTGWLAGRYATRDAVAQPARATAP